ncbi:DUF397 domain-containing protein [Streptomyces sp. NPDC008313]|uniref:DUF397 domain-containing protein n=1 Tax=Streptomyces sp. NPDC008313 TaxID=3364826 RepID=UPI0036E48ACF
MMRRGTAAGRRDEEPAMLPYEGWHRSTRSNNTNCACVEVGRRSRGVLVRDSKNVARRPLFFGREAWTAFLDTDSAFGGLAA